MQAYPVIPNVGAVAAAEVVVVAHEEAEADSQEAAQDSRVVLRDSRAVQDLVVQACAAVRHTGLAPAVAWVYAEASVTAMVRAVMGMAAVADIMAVVATMVAGADGVTVLASDSV